MDDVVVVVVVVVEEDSFDTKAEQSFQFTQSTPCSRARASMPL